MSDMPELVFSILCFAAGLLWCLFSGPVSRKLHKNAPLSAVHGLTIGTAAALFSLYLMGSEEPASGPLDAAFTAILGTLRAITGENTVFETRSMAGTIPQGWIWAFNLYTALLHLLAYALVFGLILSLLKNFFPKLQYLLFSSGRLCIFSDLNERAVLLAEDLRRQHPKAVLVFLCVREDNETEAQRQWAARAKAIRAYCFSDDETALPIPPGCRKSRVDFILLEEGENENLRCALELTEQYRGHSNVRITLASSQPEAEAFVDSAEKDGLSLRLLHEARSIVFQLYDTMPLFLGAKEGRLEILVVGMGKVGLEAVRTACWCGQTADLRPIIHVVDRDPLAASRFARLCPELADSPAETACRVCFHQLDAEGCGFSDFLRSHTGIGYVICALEEESLNLRTAMEIRRCFEELHPDIPGSDLPCPIINVLLRDPFLSRTGRELIFASRPEYPLRLNSFGSLQEIYTWENISGSYLETMAFGFHQYYDGSLNSSDPEASRQSRRNFENSAYNRRSSMALALHCKYKLYSALPCWRDPSRSPLETWSGHPSRALQEAFAAYLQGEDLPPDERKPGSADRLEELARLEHRRWNAFMRADGWRAASPEQLRGYWPVLHNHRSMLAKLHPCLVPWEQLPEISALCTELGTPRDFPQSDRNMIQAIPMVLQLTEQAKK